MGRAQLNFWKGAPRIDDQLEYYECKHYKTKDKK